MSTLFAARASFSTFSTAVSKLWSWPLQLWNRSLRFRLIASYSIVFVVTLTILLARMGQIVYKARIEEAEHYLEIETFLAANALEDPLSGYDKEFEEFEEYHRLNQEEERKDVYDENSDVFSLVDVSNNPAFFRNNPQKQSESNHKKPTAHSRLQFIVQNYSRDLGARMTILNATGNVLADSHYPADQIPNQFTAVEVQAALRLEEQHDIRPDVFTGELAIFAAAPIQRGEHILGIVQVSQPFAPVVARAQGLIVNLAVTALGALLLTILLGIWLSHQLVNPIHHIKHVALSMAKGDLERRVLLKTDDELGAMAKAFNYMASQLQDMVERQRLFVANASHELRTPLTNIKLRSELLLDDELEPALRQRYLEELDREAGRLIRLANTLLDLSRMEKKAEKPDSPLDIVQVVSSIVRETHLRAQAKGINWSAQIADSLPNIRMWPEHLETIVVNLADNAIKYTPEGGKVCLTIDAAEGQLRIQVSDTGIGIPTEEIPRIFDRFYQVDKSRSRRQAQQGWGSGAGLGLYLVKLLVTQYGGLIHIESTNNQGTTFLIELPVCG